jgi:7-carboxy-7-deazaguanine synthase
VTAIRVPPCHISTSVPSFIFPAAFVDCQWMSGTLVINEVYLSLQGESTFAGLPCIFIRLTACNLRCSYCDTAYAFTEGSPRPLHSIIDEVGSIAARYTSQPGRSKLPLVELTGGEPLLQRNSLPLMRQLCDLGFEVLVETSGALDISQVDPRVHRIMDLKCPSSGESERNRLENIPCLKDTDEVKFVIGTREDYDWAKEQLSRHKLVSICPILFSWVSPLSPEQQHKALKPVPAGQHPITRLELVESIIADALPVRFQLQMHKFIWAPEKRGV